MVKTSCGLDDRTVAEHTACLTWLKNNAKANEEKIEKMVAGSEKIELMYTKLVVGNGKPPLQEQINSNTTLVNNNYKDLNKKIEDKFEKINESFNQHLMIQKEKTKDNKWTFEKIIAIAALLAMIYFGYQSIQNKPIIIDKNISISEKR